MFIFVIFLFYRSRKLSTLARYEELSATNMESLVSTSYSTDAFFQQINVSISFQIAANLALMERTHSTANRHCRHVAQLARYRQLDGVGFLERYDPMI